jgi:hypothetical protein
MSLAIVLAAGRSTRLPNKQLLVPNLSGARLIEQAVGFGRKLADRVVVVASSELFDAIAPPHFAPGCRVIDVGNSPATSVDSALAARWHAANDDEQIVVLDSDVVYADVEFGSTVFGDYVGLAFAPYDTSELSCAEPGVWPDLVRLGGKAFRSRSSIVGAGVYGFAGFRSLGARVEAATERSMAGLFEHQDAERFILYHWWPYGTEEQRSQYEARGFYARSAQHLPLA